MRESRDVSPPHWGPAFLAFGSWPYRLEYVAATAAILAIDFGWRMVVLREFPTDDVLLFVFFFLLPDLVSFVPFGVSRPAAGRWPTWGPSVYNFMHSLLTWAAVTVIAWLLSGPLVWPLLGWAAHITMDRSAGYYLRGRSIEAVTPPG